MLLYFSLLFVLFDILVFDFSPLCTSPPSSKNLLEGKRHRKLNTTTTIKTEHRSRMVLDVFQLMAFFFLHLVIEMSSGLTYQFPFMFQALQSNTLHPLNFGLDHVAILIKRIYRELVKWVISKPKNLVVRASRIYFLAKMTSYSGWFSHNIIELPSTWKSE